MAVIQLKVIYADGVEKTVRVTPRATVMTEEKYGAIGTNRDAAVRILYHLAWASLNRTGKESDDYETWIDKIVDVEDVTPEITDPTPGAEQPPAPSSG